MRPNLTYNVGFVKKINNLLRIVTIFALCFAAFQPQVPGSLQRLPVEGIEIILAMDLSGSMNMIDDPKDGRKRVEIAKNEAVAFIKKRPFDALGLVVFGSNSIVRCPLTHDHRSLTTIVQQMDIGNTVMPDGTVISIGLVSALNRFRESSAKSKVIILLTDGAPTPNDISIQIPLELARTLGVKIYTIGIGSGSPVNFLGLGHEATLPVELLKKIAQETDGAFFLAQNATDMKLIYEEIDRLEKQEMSRLGYATMHDQSIYPVLLACCCMVLEFIISRIFLRSLV